MENDRVFGTQIDITTPVSPYPADTPLSGVTPEHVRLPRHKPSGDFTIPNYNQTGFFQQSATPSRDGYDMGMAPSQLSNKENGSTSYHDRFSQSNGSRTTQLGNPMSKQAKRESNTLFMGLNHGSMGQREAPLSRLREAEINE
jgi:RalA-binding protein 1